jgi:hypothetical protein|tara:strand:- start:719 stop:859 length:141 start_codon:yes stop_codon:yes gene_type:complete
MTKEKLYNPDTQGTFVMMFGFKQPLRYVKDYRIKNKKRTYAKSKKV